LPTLPKVFRFAPSPNGLLHLGHAYSALINERRALASEAKLMLRIEDIDATRCKREFEEAIKSDLGWLDVAFDGVVRRQSEHISDYADALGKLEKPGLVYPCFCTRGQILRAHAGERDPDGAPLHRGRCKAVSPEEAKARLDAGESPALRLDTARALDLAPKTLAWSEYGEGRQARRVAATPLDWGDVVLRGKERSATYHLAVVVDDALQGVTDISRGRDLFAATSIHVLLQALLGLETPRYRHHRLVLDATGTKMSKSAASRPLAGLRDDGYTPADLHAALGFGGATKRKLEVRLS
jgi:glutamyl-Q tRNA(Asp) synthetase